VEHFSKLRQIWKLNWWHRVIQRAEVVLCKIVCYQISPKCR